MSIMKKQVVAVLASALLLVGCSSHQDESTQASGIERPSTMDDGRSQAMTEIVSSNDEDRMAAPDSLEEAGGWTLERKSEYVKGYREQLAR